MYALNGLKSPHQSNAFSFRIAFVHNIYKHMTYIYTIYSSV